MGDIGEDAAPEMSLGRPSDSNSNVGTVQELEGDVVQCVKLTYTFFDWVYTLTTGSHTKTTSSTDGCAVRQSKSLAMPVNEMCQ